MTNGREPLWSNQRIINAARIRSGYRVAGDIQCMSMGDAIVLMANLRDDYEARIAELEAQLAQRWQPLPDGTYHTNNAEIFKIEDGDMVTYAYGSTTRIEFYLGQAVCRLVERAEPQPYSHRNGETEPPTEAGWYWFRGNVSSSYRGEVPYSGSVTILDSMYENRGLCVISTNESPTSNIEKWQGQWYGPIVPPWEDSHE